MVTLHTDNADYNMIGGRRRYNAQRTAARALRRATVARMMRDDISLSQSDIARALGVHRSTICRDVKAVHDAWVAAAWAKSA